MKSLAEHLGVTDSQHPEKSVATHELPKNITAKEFCKNVLHSAEYRASVLQRVYLGTLSPAVECLLYHYAYGKPVEKLEVKDTTDDIDSMDAEACEREAQHLLEIARSLRQQQHDELDDEQSHSDESNARIH